MSSISLKAMARHRSEQLKLLEPAEAGILMAENLVQGSHGHTQSEQAERAELAHLERADRNIFKAARRERRTAKPSAKKRAKAESASAEPAKRKRKASRSRSASAKPAKKAKKPKKKASKSPKAKNPKAKTSALKTAKVKTAKRRAAAKPKEKTTYVTDSVHEPWLKQYLKEQAEKGWTPVTGHPRPNAAGYLAMELKHTSGTLAEMLVPLRSWTAEQKRAYGLGAAPGKQRAKKAPKKPSALKVKAVKAKGKAKKKGTTRVLSKTSLRAQGGRGVGEHDMKKVWWELKQKSTSAERRAELHKLLDEGQEIF